jgi:UTP--glucose-1-phosphate uridylyltransferase
MRIRKALITAANPAQRALPLQQLVDRGGAQKPALQLILEEANGANGAGGAEIEEFVVVVCPGDQPAYAEASGPYLGRVRFVEQSGARGYGHAILQAAGPLAGEDAFLHLVGDHLYVSREGESCAQQLVAVALAERAAVSAVQATREALLPYFGAVGGRLVPGGRRLYQVEAVVEKPSPTEAERRLLVPGLRAGHYLCFFGMHVLTPGIFPLLEEAAAAADPGAGLLLSPALNALASRERYLALEVAGHRHDIGARYGVLMAQFALSLTGRDRDLVLRQMLELLALA